MKAAMIFMLLACFHVAASAQVCSINTMPTRINYGDATDLLSGDKDIDLNEDSTSEPLARAWVNTRFLNVRDAPHYGNINGMVFLGEPVYLFAKTGDWVAISRPVTLSGNEFGQLTWVHKSYLAAYPPNQKITLNALKSKCSFEQMLHSKKDNKPVTKCNYVLRFVRANSMYGRHKIYKPAFYEWALSVEKLELAKVALGGCDR